ncbi:Outer membrane protein assembly factor BamB, contains PQQ-like beta-propeller repeat [Paracoccus thiocyanatus]|uniref:Outer membrane protein assembly factor BamB, contains PQQ-like beta-propeller repeat n=1 Tax=Paracoccus thiocyanatus TaxID=34006 RepID=A0A1N6QHH9_9RHOB|nr:PQQ-binding-like beta-propeller repeat protein [Paracoccus thiocyanatus]SIQ16054.1 Outer membrane protein assembly factor BamB, contains PQQ-like beta-propeller repeat [Paracoccus thiocyanatus]
MTRLSLIAALAGLTALSACAERDTILPGERLDPRAVLSPDSPAVQGAQAPTTAALSLPPMRANADWPQRAGNAAHAPGNVALGAGTRRVWAAPIGTGSDKRHRITAEPVVAGGLAFTLDSQSTVTATTTGGGRAWSVDLRPAGESGRSVSGGGLAFAGNRVFASTGYGELVALDARTGGVAWRQKVGSTIGGAPTVANGVVYVLDREQTGWAVRANDGKVLWRSFGNKDMAGVMGATAPAVSGGTVVFPSNTGALTGVDAGDGSQLWVANVGGTRLGRAVSYFRDMTGDPVIQGNTLYAGTSAGGVGAYDLASGAMKWHAREGAASPVLAAGNSVFLVNDQAQLIRLDAANGSRVWAQKLPYFTEQVIRKQDRVWNHYGPVLAGSRLYLASSDGYLRVFDPASGALIGTAQIPGGAAAGPAVAGQTLYVVTHDGQLIAYR